MSVSVHLPVLQVVVPLLCAPLCALIPDGRRAWGFSLVVAAIAATISVLLLGQVVEQGPISYALGGWAAPWGIEYRIDFANALVMLLVSMMGLITLLFARDSVEREIPRRRLYLFYTAWNLSLTGLLGMCATGDAFNVFVFLEIASLSGYTLISMARNRSALSAAFRYLIMGTVGGTFFLIGIGLMYGVTGTLNMADLGSRLPAMSDNLTVRMAYAFITVGIGLKTAIFPLHAWLPRAYATAPSAVTVFIASTSTKVSLYIWIRFTFDLFGMPLVFEQMFAGPVLAGLSCVGIALGSLAALYQRDVKLVLAYSSVAQVGYMTLGVSLASIQGVSAAFVHLFNHALMKGALFVAVGCVVYRVGVSDISAFRGIGRRMPFTMAAFSLAGLSLIGVPFTAGFVSKWLLLDAVFEAGYPILAVFLVLTSLIALAYVGRIIEVAYFHAPTPSTFTDRAREAPALMQAALWLLVLANLYFGLDTGLSAGIASDAARALLEQRP